MTRVTLPLHHHHLRSGLTHHHHLLLLLGHLALLWLLLLDHLTRVHLTRLPLHLHWTLLHHLPWLVHLLLVRRPHRHSINMACWPHELTIWSSHHHSL